MRGVLFASMAVVVLMVSCQNNQESSGKSKDSFPLKEQVEDCFFNLEFINPYDAGKYSDITGQVKRELYNNGYIAGNETNIDWQGIEKNDSIKSVDPGNISEFHRCIHRFRDFSECNQDMGDIEKIVIAFIEDGSDSIPGFSYRLYKKQGHAEWQSVFNPGDFRFIDSTAFDEAEFAKWMIEKIVLLTFK